MRYRMQGTNKVECGPVIYSIGRNIGIFFPYGSDIRIRYRIFAPELCENLFNNILYGTCVFRLDGKYCGCLPGYCIALVSSIN